MITNVDIDPEIPIVNPGQRFSTKEAIDRAELWLTVLDKSVTKIAQDYIPVNPSDVAALAIGYALLAIAKEHSS